MKTEILLAYTTPFHYNESNRKPPIQNRKEDAMICEAIDRLTRYGIENGMIQQRDTVYVRNRLLDVMREDAFTEPEPSEIGELADILKELTDIAVERGLCTDSTESRDIFDTRLMDVLMPKPAEAEEYFAALYDRSPLDATEWYYKLSCDSNYIRRDRIRKDRKWTYDSEYGTLDITINLSKPEKDPRDIAAAGKAKSTAYPKCQLCAENEGYAGRIGHPARANHRVVTVELDGDSYRLQYSPYVYYNEHCIVFNAQHVPMKIDRDAFRHLLAFTGVFPHYFLGSNADLPIVGGSILSHDHFQGGHYTFAMEKAPIEEPVVIKGYEDVECGIVKWPLSVIRIRHDDPKRLTELATHVLVKWRSYTDEAAFIYAETDGTPHNTITPIARRRDGKYELDLCLRNNITTEENPLGVYHPHAQWHHIKKENIGLIEVMGLAVLPARLNRELDALEDAVIEGRDIRTDEALAKHAEWLDGFRQELSGKSREEIRDRLQKEVGEVFMHVLEDAGVYKRTPEGKAAFLRFIETL